MTIEIKELVIERATWLRGTGNGTLLTIGGNRCCLGFLGRQVGIPDENLCSWGLPAETATELGDRWPIWLIAEVMYDEEETQKGWVETPLGNRLISINDHELGSADWRHDFPAPTTEDERESMLAVEFARVGVTVRFV